MHAYIHAYTCTYMHICIPSYMQVLACIHTYMHTYMHAYIHTFMNTYMYTYVPSYRYACSFSSFSGSNSEDFFIPVVGLPPCFSWLMSY